jgi:hypothetical protein
LSPRYRELSGGPVTAEEAAINFNDVFAGVWALWGMYFCGWIWQLQIIGAAIENPSLGVLFAVIIWLTNVQLWGGIFLGTITGFIASERSLGEKELLAQMGDSGTMPTQPTKLWERFWAPNVGGATEVSQEKKLR